MVLFNSQFSLIFFFFFFKRSRPPGILPSSPPRPFPDLHRGHPRPRAAPPAHRRSAGRERGPAGRPPPLRPPAHHDRHPAAPGATPPAGHRRDRTVP